MVTQARKPQSKVHPVVVKPVPEVVDIESIIVADDSDDDDATPVEVLENEGSPSVKSVAELVVLQEAAEAAPEVPLESASKVPATKYEVRFTAAHTFGTHVYREGETAFVPRDHSFYGMSPEEQEEKTGKIHFVPVKD